MGCDLGGCLDGSAVFQKHRNPGRPESMAAHRCIHPGFQGTSLDYPVGVNAAHTLGGELLAAARVDLHSGGLSSSLIPPDSR